MTMKGIDVTTAIYAITVIYMVTGCIIFSFKQLRYHLKFTIFIFISVVIGLGLICFYNYFKIFNL